jgi:hypothetical protein
VKKSSLTSIGVIVQRSASAAGWFTERTMRVALERVGDLVVGLVHPNHARYQPHTANHPDE